LADEEPAKKKKTTPLFLGILSALLWTAGTLAIMWLGGFMAFMIYVWTLSPAPVTKKADAIVVLTGGTNRINTGLDLLNEGAAKQLFISGVDTRVDEEKILDLWGKKKKDIPCCIALGYQAQNTEQNATEARDWIKEKKIKSVRLVTSGYHVPRALLEFNYAVPNVTIIVHPVDAGEKDTKKKWFWMTAFEEYNKAILVALRFWPEDLKS